MSARPVREHSIARHGSCAQHMHPGDIFDSAPHAVPGGRSEMNAVVAASARAGPVIHNLLRLNSRFYLMARIGASRGPGVLGIIHKTREKRAFKIFGTFAFHRPSRMQTHACSRCGPRAVASGIIRILRSRRIGGLLLLPMEHMTGGDLNRRIEHAGCRRTRPFPSFSRCAPQSPAPTNAA